MRKPEELLKPHLPALKSAKRVLVGYSGGLDSTVLLKATTQAIDAVSVLAVHINHQLNPEADQWQAHCEQFATELGCEFYTESVAIDDEKGIEEAARQKRYEVFERLLGHKDLLLLGHHADDQAETLLFRLLRGSGLKGLSGIPEQRSIGHARLLRPLLRVTKKELLEVAKDQKLRWVEDNSNENTAFDRNFIRNDLLPIIRKRWPSSDAQLVHAANVLGETDALVSDIADTDLDICDLRTESVGVSVAIELVEALSEPRRNNLLRRYVYRASGYVPNRQQTEALHNNVVQAKEDAQPSLALSGVVARRFQNRLYLTPEIPPIEELVSRAWIWLRDQDRLVMDGLWEISRVQGNQIDANTELSVRLRRGGERLKPVGRKHSQTLKKLLLEYEIEPWLRDLLPIIYQGDQIIAVGDKIHCSNIRFQLRWLIEPIRGFR